MLGFVVHCGEYNTVTVHGPLDPSGMLYSCYSCLGGAEINILYLFYFFNGYCLKHEVLAPDRVSFFSRS